MGIKAQSVGSLRVRLHNSEYDVMPSDLMTIDLITGALGGDHRPTASLPGPTTAREAASGRFRPPADYRRQPPRVDSAVVCALTRWCLAAPPGVARTPLGPGGAPWCLVALTVAWCSDLVILGPPAFRKAILAERKIC
jgi:hypothetical protein